MGKVTGDYVISYRYDCEQTPQVWQQCGDVRIIDGTPPPADQCDNPACASCCTGTCKNCRGYCEEHKDDTCEGCWKESDGAPPCNLRGCACFADDELSCQACFKSEPLPAGWKPPAVDLTPPLAADVAHLPWAPPAAPVIEPPQSNGPEDFCRTDVPQCESCCTGSCTGCRGYCEGTKDGDCIHCWTGADNAPICNFRGTQCLADDGLSCEMCWKPPQPPSPVPRPPSPPPVPTPGPVEPCPGGSFDVCIEYCPSDPTEDFHACLHLCQERCDDWKTIV